MLMEIQDLPCISLFSNTYRYGADIQQNRMKLLNQVREVKRYLHAREPSTREPEAASLTIASLLQPIYALLETRDFWLRADQSMAILCAPGSFHVYGLPFRVKEQIVIGSHFYLKPLLPLLNDGSYFVLAMSQNEIRFFEGTRYSIHEVDLPPSVPKNLAEVLKYDQPDNQANHYSSSSEGSLGMDSRRSAIFYGQGVGTDDTKKDLLRYCQQIDRGLHELLHERQAPLALAGVEYLMSLYREANKYPHLVEHGIAGNPDQLSAETLRERAWDVVETYVLAEQQEAQARYRELAQTDQASSNVSEVVPVAYEGRIAALFVALDHEQWGTFDPATYSIEIHEDPVANDEGLLDLAARQTLLHGGSVFAVEQACIPDQTLVAAILRY